MAPAVLGNIPGSNHPAFSEGFRQGAKSLARSEPTTSSLQTKTTRHHDQGHEIANRLFASRHA